MEASHEQSRFHWADYVVFVITLLLSSSVGVFYAIKDKLRKTNNVDDFLLAGRSMSVFPVSVSMFVSWLSAISFIGDPVEVYYHGAIYWIIGIGYCLAVPPVAEYFAVKLHKLRLYSVFQFIENRYNFPFRILVSILGCVAGSLYSSIVLYAPALSLAQASGISVWVSIVGVGLVCTFYTSLGGIKAVFWADTIQTLIMIIGLVAMIIRGCVKVGGLTEIWHIAQERERINFLNFDPNPFVRSTVWTYLFGGFWRVFNPYITTQMFMQRYSSLKTTKDVKMAVYFNFPMYAVFVSLFALTGLMMVAYFKDCDPMASGRIEKVDQMVPLMMIELLGFIPGAPGLFLASLFCASLSTISSTESSMAINLLKDFVEPAYRKIKHKPLSPKASLILAKLFTVMLGFLFIGLSLIVMNLKDSSIFQMTLKVTGCITGPTAGVFFVGLLMPFVDTLSAFIGWVCGLSISIWWSLGSMFTELPRPPALPISTAGCMVSNGSYISSSWNYVMNSTESVVTEMTDLTSTSTHASGGSGVGIVYQLSPLLYSVLGFWVALIVAVFLSVLRSAVSGKKIIWRPGDNKTSFPIDDSDDEVEYTWSKA